MFMSVIKAVQYRIFWGKYSVVASKCRRTENSGVSPSVDTYVHVSPQKRLT